MVRSAAGLPFLLEEGMPVAFVPPALEGLRSGTVGSITHLKDSAYLVHFDEVSNRETAENLVGKSCLVKRSLLPQGFDQESESGLVGYEVCDDVLGVLGQVQELVELRLQSRLAVGGSYGEILIPFVDEFILAVDDRQRTITTHIPKDLLDLAREDSSGIRQ